jgi:glutamine synthetase
LECRLPGADANPYLSIAATLIAGLYGIEHQIEPGPETEGNAYLQKIPAKLRLPASYAEAIERFNRSKIAREWLGNAFVETFVSGRRAQEEEFRHLITEAEVERFLELS